MYMCIYIGIYFPLNLHNNFLFPLVLEFSYITYKFLANYVYIKKKYREE